MPVVHECVLFLWNIKISMFTLVSVVSLTLKCTTIQAFFPLGSCKLRFSYVEHAGQYKKKCIQKFYTLSSTTFIILTFLKKNHIKSYIPHKANEKNLTQDIV